MKGLSIGIGLVNQDLVAYVNDIKLSKRAGMSVANDEYKLMKWLLSDGQVRSLRVKSVQTFCTYAGMPEELVAITMSTIIFSLSDKEWLSIIKSDLVIIEELVAVAQQVALKYSTRGNSTLVALTDDLINQLNNLKLQSV